MSYRLGGTDGVAVEAAKWARAFEVLGVEVVTIAGSGTADVLIDGLAADAIGPIDQVELRAALSQAELVVVENCCSLPLNPRAGRALAAELRGRPAVLRHHDLVWQRPGLSERAGPPDDPCWRHVTINERSRLELAARGIEAVTMYNCFEPDPPRGARDETRGAVEVGAGERLLLQPTRAIRRKNVAGGLLLAAAIGATYWLLGPAEDGYEDELRRLLDAAAGLGVRVLRGGGCGVADAYAACDAVVLPSTWEGFGNPAIESALHKKPLAIGAYPVSIELRRYGFSWFDLGDAERLGRFLDAPDFELLERNRHIARLRFSTEDLPERLTDLVTAG